MNQIKKDIKAVILAFVLGAILVIILELMKNYTEKGPTQTFSHKEFSGYPHFSWTNWRGCKWKYS